MATRTHKRKKNSRQRGSGGHGWGAKKKHRGSGNRGGTGNAGSGKRGQSKRFTTRFVREHFGKHGFTIPNHQTINAVNLQYLEDSADTFVAEGKASAAGDTITIDLTAMGIGKLLSKGPVTRKLNITVARASANAVQKVQAVGGSVTVTEPREA